MDWGMVGSTVLRGVLAYAMLVLYIRVSGNRTLAKMRAFDFVVTISLGTLLASAITSAVPVWQALLAMALLILLQWIVARAGVASSAFNDLVTNKPIRVFHDGGIDERALRKARMTRDEIDSAIRRAGLQGETQVKEVWLEVNGDVSVVRR